MTPRIIAPANCGNSPKSAFAQEFVIALLSGDVEHISSYIHADITVDIVGQGGNVFGELLVSPNLPEDGILKGQVEVLSFVRSLNKAGKISTLEIEAAFAHGKVAAINGVLTAAKNVRGFSIFLTFATLKADSVKKVQIYLP